VLVNTKRVSFLNLILRISPKCRNIKAFGILRFETEKRFPNTQGVPKKFCFLNFDQSDRAPLSCAFDPAFSGTVCGNVWRVKTIAFWAGRRIRLKKIRQHFSTLSDEIQRGLEPLYNGLEGQGSIH
jgi:hypothetical protein